jgi:sugar phosphate isomerase/epimerase
MKLGLLTYNMARNWDLPLLLDRAQALGFDGVSFRVDQGHAHGVELSLSPIQRREVRDQVESSGLEVCGLSSGCRYDALDAQELRSQIDRTKALLQLAADVGASGLKVFGNSFHEDEGVPREETMRQIASALRECGEFAAGLVPDSIEKGSTVEVRFEMHGDLNPWPYSVRLMELADHRNVSLIYNCDPRDVVDGSIRVTLEHVRPWLRHVHLHDLTDPFPYSELFDFLVDISYNGYTVGELPASSDSERVLAYFGALWRAHVDLASRRRLENRD